MNPWVSLLEQFAAQIVATEGPVVIQGLEGALNNALIPHGHTVTITPVPVPVEDTAARPASKDNPAG